MLDGQRKSVDVPAHAAEKTGRDSLLIRPSGPPDDPVGQGTELN